MRRIRVLNNTQILIDRYLSEEMTAVSKDLDVIMDSQKDLTAESVKSLCMVYGAKWDVLNRVRNYVFNLEGRHNNG